MTFEKDTLPSQIFGKKRIGLIQKIAPKEVFLYLRFCNIVGNNFQHFEKRLLYHYKCLKRQRLCTCLNYKHVFLTTNIIKTESETPSDLQTFRKKIAQGQITPRGNTLISFLFFKLVKNLNESKEDQVTSLETLQTLATSFQKLTKFCFEKSHNAQKISTSCIYAQEQFLKRLSATSH